MGNKKLLNISVRELVKPTISIFPDNVYEANTSDEPEKVILDFFVPDYLVFAAFDDGSVEIQGITIESLSDLPYDAYESKDALRHYASLNMVKAFIGTRLYYGYVSTEEEAKRQILEELHDSGIEVDEEAKNYLNWYETYN